MVANNRSMNKLPKVEGLLSYRSDDRKLYLKEKSQWQALANQKDVSFFRFLSKRNNVPKTLNERFLSPQNIIFFFEIRLKMPLLNLRVSRKKSTINLHQ